MLKKQEQLKDAIFLITQEKSCPVYNLGEEIKVANSTLTTSSFKPCCLFLAEKIKELVVTTNSFGGISRISQTKSRFDCGGCEGMVHFEYKKEKDFATVQMKLLNEAEEKRKKQHLEKFFSVLRAMKIFSPLEDDALTDLTLMLDLKTIPKDKVVVKKGDQGSNLYIVLEGKLAVINDNGETIANLAPGNIFGEMSLLSGEPVSHTIHTNDTSRLALLSLKNFRNVIVKYPILQLFLFKLLIKRAQMAALKSGNISSGMSGTLSDISTIDLLQMIHSSQKTGVIKFAVKDGKAAVLFNQGQIVYARFHKKTNQDAVYTLLNRKEGNFSYFKGLPSEFSTLPPIGDFMAILIEGVQKIDEEESQSTPPHKGASPRAGTD